MTWAVHQRLDICRAQAASRLAMGAGESSTHSLGACRCVVQLMLLGFILVPIFQLDAWWLNSIYAFGFMLSVASVEAVSRPPAYYKVSHCFHGRLLHVLGAHTPLALRCPSPLARQEPAPTPQGCSHTGPVAESSLPASAPFSLPCPLLLQGSVQAICTLPGELLLS